MALKIASKKDGFHVMDGRKAITTPAGRPLVTRYEAIASEMAQDLETWGPDPSRRTTMYALQSGYLDFGLRIPREMLEEPILGQWRSDLFVNRPADPELMMPLLALWGNVPFGKEEFTRRVQELPLRKLMVLMQCGAQYKSSVLGIQLLSSAQNPTGLALGACARYFAYLSRDMTLANGYLNFGSSVAERHDPNYTDDDYCDNVCCSEAGPDVQIADRCPMFQTLNTMRRWAGFPEEDL